PRIKPFALCGQRYPPPVAQEQRLAEPFLEPLDLHRNRRLRLVDPPCGLGETAAIGDGAEGLQLVEVEGTGHVPDPSQNLISKMKSICLNNESPAPISS